MPAPRARLLALCLAPLVVTACARRDEPAAPAEQEQAAAKSDDSQSPVASLEEQDATGKKGGQDALGAERGRRADAPASAPTADVTLGEGNAGPADAERSEADFEEVAEEEPAPEPEPSAASKVAPGGGAGGAPPSTTGNKKAEGGNILDGLVGGEPSPPPPKKTSKARPKSKKSGGADKADLDEDGFDDLDRIAKDDKRAPTETASPDAPADRGIGGEAPAQTGGAYEPKHDDDDEGRFAGQPSPLDDLPIVAGDDEPEVHTRRYGVNRTVETAAEPILRFAASLDLASFHLCQLALAAGQLPDPGAVRVESFLAAAGLSYPAPAADEPLSVSTSTMESQSREGFYVLRVGVTAPTSASSGAPVVFAIAVGDESDRVKRVRAALAKTVQEANEQGVPIAIATPGKALEPDSVDDAAKKRFRTLSVEGTLPPALDRAYALAETIGAHKIVLVSDGMPDGRVRDPAALVRTIDTHAANGVRLAVAGVGNDHYDDGLLELLSRAGRGRYEHGSVDAKASLLDVAAADAVAQDLELELVFSPEHVSRYRLVGYERRLAGRRGEIFAPGKGGLRPGESITALVEYKPKQDASGPIALVRAHYLDRKGSRREVEIDAEFEDELHPDETVALVAAGLAEKLRGAYWARTLTYDDLADALAGLPPEVAGRASVKALAQMVSRAKALDDRPDRFAEEQPLGGMSFDALPLQ